MKICRLCLSTALIFTIVVFSPICSRLTLCLAATSAEEAVPSTKPLTEHEAVPTFRLPVIACAEGYHGNNCQSAIDAIALSLGQLQAHIAGWRVVVVPASRWPVVVTDFAVKRSAPAFSDLRTTTTYVSDALIFLRAGTEVQLAAVTRLRGTPRLKWALAHEYGHLVCHTKDEDKAERAASHLQYGKSNVCD